MKVLRDIRIHSLFWCLFILSLGCIKAAFAENKEAIPVQWFEPKVKPASPGATYVLLIGRTQPKIQVGITPQNIMIIHQTSDQKIQPEVKRRLVQSNHKGFFKLLLTVPNGLTQVPITFTDRSGRKQPVLLTMRVDPENVSLNVKVTRPEKIKVVEKVVKVVESPKATYSLGLGWNPVMFQQDLKVTDHPNYSLQTTSLKSLAVDMAMEYPNWWWFSKYEISDFEAPKSLNGSPVLRSSFQTQRLLLGGKYKLVGGAYELWFDLDADGIFMPVMSISSGNEVDFIKSKMFRLGTGLTYVYPSDDVIYVASIKYKEPFSLKVDSGHIVYESNFALTFSGGVNYFYHDNWIFGASAGMDLNSFDYEYNKSSANISNQGQGRTLIYQILLKAQWAWDSYLD